MDAVMAEEEILDGAAAYKAASQVVFLFIFTRTNAEIPFLASLVATRIY